MACPTIRYNSLIEYPLLMFSNFLYSIIILLMNAAEKSKKFAKDLLSGSLQAVFPPGCLKCGDPLESPGNLCNICWPQLTFISEPCCELCGFPFEYSAASSLICGSCLRKAPSFARARAVLKYDEACRNMVLAFKHADQTRNAPAFAGWMYRAAPDMVAECDIICAAPLHPFRLLRRRYNQSALLALELARLSCRPALPDLLYRKRPTPSQGGLNATARRRNVDGVFAVTPKWLSRIENTRILLLDDVLTTGATVEASSKALLNAGAAKIDVLTLCRVVRTTSLAI